MDLFDYNGNNFELYRSILIYADKNKLQREVRGLVDSLALT